MIIAILGWLGTICFAISGVPQAWQCTIQRHARGVNPFTLSLWMAGEVFYTIAVLAEFGWVGWLLINYIVNILVISVIIFWKVRGNAKENQTGETHPEESGV